MRGIFRVNVVPSKDDEDGERCDECSHRDAITGNVDIDETSVFLKNHDRWQIRQYKHDHYYLYVHNNSNYYH